MREVSIIVTTSLLEPDEPGPVLKENGSGRSPILFIADHAGRALPRRLGDLGLPAGETARHIGWDIGIWEVGRLLAARFDAPLLGQRYSRLVVDCNRPPGVPTSIPDVSEDTLIPGNVGLSDALKAARVEAIFKPYHAAIEAELDARQEAGRPTILVSLHSFTPVFKGVARPWQVGLLFNRDRRLASVLKSELEAMPEIEAPVGMNEPYAVSDHHDYAVPVHGERRGLPHVALELRQDLIEHAPGQHRWAGLFGDALERCLKNAQRWT